MKLPFYPLALISLLFFVPTSRGADPKPAEHAPAPQHEERFVTFDVNFRGGAVSDLLNVVSKIDGISFNVIIATPSPNKPENLPAFSLHNAHVMTLAEVVRALAEAQGYVASISSSSANTVVLVLRRNPVPMMGWNQDGSRPNQFVSYQLAPYLTEQTVDDIVSAMRAAWELDPAHDRDALKLKFHPPTSILLVSGPDEAINTTQSVLRQLRHGPEKTAKPAAPAEHKP